MPASTKMREKDGGRARRADRHGWLSSFYCGKQIIKVLKKNYLWFLSRHDSRQRRPHCTLTHVLVYKLLKTNIVDYVHCYVVERKGWGGRLPPPCPVPLELFFFAELTPCFAS